jgi:predicted Zn-dependent protease
VKNLRAGAVFPGTAGTGARLVRRWLMAIAAVLVVHGCASVETTEPGTVGVDRRQTMSQLVNEADINEGARQAYAQVLAEARSKGALNRDPAQLARVRGIAQRIIPHTATFRPDAAKWQWEVNVLSSPEVNAWCMPGGKIAFYSGILERLQLTDDEAAAVMGHEIAHALREHGRERASRAVNQSIALGVLGAAVGAPGGALDLAQLALEVTLNLPNSREQEIEADRIGVELAARAGYNPRAAISLWQKMAHASQGGPPQWLSTHPSREARIQDLEVYAAKVMPLYQASGARSAAPSSR